MKIERLHIRCYRTLVDLKLEFPTFYAAICGRNDCGKTNVVRAIRGLMKEDEPFTIQDEQSFSLKNDFPKWLESDTNDRRISVSVDLSINSERDAGLYEFINTYLSLQSKDLGLSLTVKAEFGGTETDQTVSVAVGDEVFEDMRAQEVLKKLQAARVVLFHNSAYEDRPIVYRPRLGGYLRDFSGEAREHVESMKTTVDKKLKKIAKGQQREIEELLGRLESSSKSASKNTPVIIVEEPESFLHPSAQAEFGRVLQDLAEEFKVQVITTTHSPYMLSIDKPESNVLLERRIFRRQHRETRAVDTSGEHWMEPFGLALGVDNTDFAPWKDVLFSQSECILLVEGDIDKEYFGLLRDAAHGTNQLRFSGEIFPYGGRGNLKNTLLLKFIMNRYRHIFVTYDLDAEGIVEEYLVSLGLQKRKNYAPVGLNKSGRKCIEGLVPSTVTSVVYAANPELVQKAMAVATQENRSARQELKRKILEEFKSISKPGQEYFSNFYPLVQMINRALQ